MSVIIVLLHTQNIAAVHDKDYIVAYGAGGGTGPESEKFNKILNDWNEKAKKLGHFVGEYVEN